MTTVDKGDVILPVLLVILIYLHRMNRFRKGKKKRKRKKKTKLFPSIPAFASIEEARIEEDVRIWWKIIKVLFMQAK